MVGVGGWAIWSLTTPPPSADCRQLSATSTDMERLYCAQESARSGELPKILAAIDLLGQWKPDHPLYREAQRLIGEWSDPVLKAAQNQAENADLRSAVELAMHIPKDSPAYQEAQTAIAEWKQVWKKGEKLATAARKAMKASDWDTATIKIASLREFSQDYWRFERANALSQMLSAEQQGRQLINQAKATAQGRQGEELGGAIALISRMDSKTYAWGDAQPMLTQWSETLLNQGFQNLLKGDLNASTAFAEKVLPNPNLTQTAQDLLWLSQARRHALGSRTTLKPTLPQLWNLSAAISTASQLQANSRYYSLAQADLQNWIAQLQDLTLLQTAYAIGEIQQIPTLQLASWQGQQITSDRPRRTQAQTLVVYWQQAIRKLEDRPYLIYAEKLARQGTITAFKNAIAQATQILPNRPLRKEAQTQIANWMAQIQIIEDRPILDQAWGMANLGQLNEAILMASSIDPGRALYGESQAAIGKWQAQIQAAAIAKQKERDRELEQQLRNRTPAPAKQDYPEANPDYYPAPEQPSELGLPQPYPAPFPSPEGGSSVPSEQLPPPPAQEPPPPPSTFIVPTEPVPPPPPQ
jgi:hypothetical protein